MGRSKTRPVAVCHNCHCSVEIIPITVRMQEVLMDLMAGKRASEIAHHLHINTRTVEYHRKKLYRAAGVDNLIGLIRWALKVGFEFPPPDHPLPTSVNEILKVQDDIIKNSWEDKYRK